MEWTESRNKRKELIGELVESIGAMPHVTSTIEQQTKILWESHLSQIEDCITILSHPSDRLYLKNQIEKKEELPPSAKVACQGVAGAYSHIACETVFLKPEITFFPQFEQVAIAIEVGEAEYGVLPFENSSVGSVADITEYIDKHNCYINTMLQVKIEHCLCVRPGTLIKQISKVISHPQALMQCASTLDKMKLPAEAFANTAMAAKAVSESEEPLACLCSSRSAELYQLEILQNNMQDIDENYTRFVCIASKAVVLPKANTISVVLSLPNETGALGNLLTQFMVLGLDLTRIQSMPIGGAEFNVRFHLDFTGNIFDAHVANLLGHMYNKYEDFTFIGNFRSLD